MSTISARVGSDTYPVVVSDSALYSLSLFCSNYSKDSLLIIADVCFNDPTFSYPELDSLFDFYSVLFIDGGIESKGLSGYQRVIEWGY